MNKGINNFRKFKKGGAGCLLKYTLLFQYKKLNILKIQNRHSSQQNEYDLTLTLNIHLNEHTH